jgi:phenolic acid decarboxylase
MEPSVAAIRFTDGVWRDVFEEPTGRQYVLDHDGERVYGVWFIPRDEPEPDVVVGASA